MIAPETAMCFSLSKEMKSTNARMVPGLPSGPAHLALFGADQLLHNFVHAFHSLLFILPGPRIIAANRCYQRRGSIRHHVANTRMRQQHAVIAIQRGWRELPPDTKIHSNGTMTEPDHLAAKFPSRHALLWFEVRQYFIIARQPVIRRIIASRLPIDAQRLVG